MCLCIYLCIFAISLQKALNAEQHYWSKSLRKVTATGTSQREPEEKGKYPQTSD